MVSIVCNTYNHEKYIADALEGFVMQKTNFAFEILVHDDASTDRTADIIREYEAKYPDLIKPIYQTENQYSKHPITTFFQLPRVQGKYVAFCEGDDYWTDDHKLQKQVDALEAHPELDICAHDACLMCDGKVIGWQKPSDTDCVIPVEEVIAGGGGFVGTASLVYRSTMIDVYKRVWPFDYTWQIYGSLRGGMLYIAEPMCVYRVAVSGSWSARTSADMALRDRYAARIESMLYALDEETEGKYSQTIQNRITYNRVVKLLDHRDYKQALAKENRNGFKRMPLKKKIKAHICAVFPWVDTCWEKLKKGS